MAENASKSVKVVTVRNQRDENKPNVKCSLTVTNTDQVAKEDLSLVIEAGIRVLGGTYLKKQLPEDTKQGFDGTISLHELVEDFRETAGTRTSAKQEYEKAVDRINKLNASIAHAGEDLAVSKIDTETFMERVQEFSARKKEVEDRLPELKQAWDSQAAKMAASRKKK